MQTNIDLWPIDIDSVDLERAEATLSESERSRATAITDPTAQKIFTACRGDLRRVLSIYLDVTPSTIPISTTPSGKPEVGRASNVKFNVSHSEDLGLIAVSRGAEVGVDVQPHDPDRPIMDIAKRFFTPREYEHLCSRSSDDSVSAFYSFWSRKEALVKAVGSSLGSSLTGLDVLGNGWIMADLAKVGEDSTRTFGVTDLKMPEGFAGAVALELTDNDAVPDLTWRTLS